MLKIEEYEPKPGFIKSVIRYIHRRIAAFSKPTDYCFIPEYRKFKLDPEAYVLDGHQYFPNFRKTIGQPRHLRASALSRLIMEYNLEIEGLRVFRGTVYFNGDVIRNAQSDGNFETVVVEYFLDFCFFYLTTKVEKQQSEKG